jgi:hypothetical protein
MDQQLLDNLIDGLIRSRARIWTALELAEETGRPLSEVQSAIDRLVTTRRAISTGQDIRRVLPREGYHA